MGLFCLSSATDTLLWRLWLSCISDRWGGPRRRAAHDHRSFALPRTVISQGGRIAVGFAALASTGSVFIFVGLFGSGAKAGSLSGPAWNLTGDCAVSSAPPGYRSAHVAGDPYEVLADDANFGYAQIYEDAASSRAGGHRIWDMWQHALSATPPQPAPIPYFQIFIVPGAELPANIDGVDSIYCGDPSLSVVALPTPAAGRTPGSCLVPVLAHELLHAFADGVAGHHLDADWWLEATAEWAQMLVPPPCPEDVAKATHAFLEQPQDPLDLFNPSGGPPQDFHHYGAYRFVEWLDSQSGSLWELLRESYVLMGRGENGTRALARAEQAQGRELGGDLGAFWASRIRPFGPGPRTEGEEWLIGVGTDRSRLGADHLAAQIVRVRLRPAVKQVMIKAARPVEGGHVWVETPHQAPSDWTEAGGEADFCVGGDLRGNRRWPDEFDLAFTNGMMSGGRLTQPLTIKTKATPCRQERACPMINGTYHSPLVINPYRRPQVEGNFEDERVTLTISCAGRAEILNSISGQVFSRPGDASSSPHHCSPGIPVELGSGGGQPVPIRKRFRHKAVTFSYRAYHPDATVTAHISLAPATMAYGWLTVIGELCRIKRPRNLSFAWAGGFGAR
jgi:hypothetical protein